MSSSVNVNRPSTWILIWTAILLSRFYWWPAYLSTDTVNLAYALESFNPKQHQPQPPGYPLFVATARLIDDLTASPEVTFWILSIVVTAASAVVLHLLTDRMLSGWAATAVVILFLLNPVLWFSRLRSPLRPWLALFSVVVAYCAWRCWNGERKFLWWGALALGVGAGFRPDLLAYLAPLWAVAAWKATHTWKAVAQGGLIIGVLAAAWLAVVVNAMGGIASSVEVITTYIAEQSNRDSILFADPKVWLRPITRLVIWNGTAVVGWLWVPIICYRSSTFKDSRWPFFLVWVCPGVLVQLFVHIASPGHTLFATPAWCVMGAFVIHQVGKHRDGVLAIAASISAALFLNVIPLGYAADPEAPALERAWVSVKNSVAFGSFETSLDRLQWWDDMASVSIQELSTLAATDRPNVTILLNGNDTEFDFVNWRVVSYYLNDRPLWVLLDNLAPGAAGRVRRVLGKDVRFSPQESIPIPKSARVLWVMLPDGKFHQALSKVMPVHRGRYILYTDPPYLAPFTIEGFVFVPS